MNQAIRQLFLLLRLKNQQKNKPQNLGMRSWPMRRPGSEFAVTDTLTVLKREYRSNPAQAPSRALFGVFVTGSRPRRWNELLNFCGSDFYDRQNLSVRRPCDLNAGDGFLFFFLDCNGLVSQNCHLAIIASSYLVKHCLGACDQTCL